MEVASLLCVGITIYSPLKYFGLDKPGMHIGVVGLGGLVHMALKFSKAFGTRVTVISTSLSKKDAAIERLGGAEGSLDGIIGTVCMIHPLLPLINLLKTHGKLAMTGAPEKPLDLPVFPQLLASARSFIGEMKETQEMMAKHNITPDIEVIPMDYVNTTLDTF
uniref:Alcohol dehydrogenase-like C-terminal domain-containing protein n=1 Tax=Solanum lycopersicum TaxID=4081 RepID=K4BRM4_SOLLC